MKEDEEWDIGRRGGKVGIDKIILLKSQRDGHILGRLIGGKQLDLAL